MYSSGKSWNPNIILPNKHSVILAKIPFQSNSNEIGSAPVLVILALIGLIGFFTFSSSVPFKSEILNSIFPKNEVQAASNLKDKTKRTLIPDQYIVILKDNVSSPVSVSEDLKKKNNLEIEYIYKSKKGLKGFSAKIPSNKLDSVKKDPRVRYVEPDVEIEIPVETSPAAGSNKQKYTKEKDSPPTTSINWAKKNRCF